MLRMIVPLAFAIIVLLSTWANVLAGGWAVVTLDHLPTELIISEPVTIGFSVRQHGQTLLAGLHPTIAATRAGSNETVTATAHDEGATGHYAASLTFPSAGDWDWYIDAFGSRQPMPRLAVAASRPVSSSALGDSQPLGAPAAWSQGVSLGALFVILMGVVVFLITWRRRQSSGLIATLALVAVVVAGIVLAVDRFPRPAVSAANDKVNSVEAVREGRDLFLAKGCIVCHQNDRVQFLQEEFVQVKIGPDLTNRTLTSEFLHVWLKDPSKVKPGTLMPTLGLSDQEIDALAAFLTAHGESQ